jgi:glycosyltransferase involved in cell wall biosynthesis
MRLVVIHNRYRSTQPSGENLVVDQETALLRAAGHEVIPYERASDDIARSTRLRQALVPARVIWSSEDRRELAKLLKRTSPDLVHVHNTFPLISPSVLEACRRHGVPVVATLHNFRLMCANAQLLRGGQPCELCVGHVPWPAVVHGCYRDSVLATIPVAVGIQVHRGRSTWTNGVSTFIAVTEFVRRRMIAGGLPGTRIRVKPNFVPRPRRARAGAGDYMLFLGRLSPEKGVDILLDAWSSELGRLLIVGDGPSRRELEARAIHQGNSVRFLGAQPRERCMDLIAGARALVVASRWYETFGLVVVEAFAHGVPAIAPSLGVFPELVQDGRTGLLFAPGEASELRSKLEELASPERSVQMGEEAQRLYETVYTPERNLEALLEIYREVIAQPPAEDGSIPGWQPS